MRSLINATVHFWATNELVLAIATFAAVIGTAWVIIKAITKVAKFVWVAIFENLATAERRKRFELALISRRCADDVSYYIAYTIRLACLHVSAFAMSMFLVIQMSLDWFDPIVAKDRSLMVLSAFSAAIVSVTGILSIATLISRSFKIASIVIIYKRRRRQRELGLPATFGRIKRVP